jgi:hypothetical protein
MELLRNSATLLTLLTLPSWVTLPEEADFLRLQQASKSGFLFGKALSKKT